MVRCSVGRYNRLEKLKWRVLKYWSEIFQHIIQRDPLHTASSGMLTRKKGESAKTFGTQPARARMRHLERMNDRILSETYQDHVSMGTAKL